MSNPNSPIPTLGASGAIAGVLGAYLLLFPGNRVRTLIWICFFIEIIDVPAVFFLALWFVGQITGVLGSYTTVGGGVAYWAHIGGFLAGMVLVVCSAVGRRRKGNGATAGREVADFSLGRVSSRRKELARRHAELVSASRPRRDGS